MPSDGDKLFKAKTQVLELKNRIQELERENEKLTDDIITCWDILKEAQENDNQF